MMNFSGASEEVSLGMVRSAGQQAYRLVGGEAGWAKLGGAGLS
ncbi:hypothetical protein [Acetobacter malorum]|nr:hypothetical protein [Acetobacter malorum]